MSRKSSTADDYRFHPFDPLPGLFPSYKNGIVRLEFPKAEVEPVQIATP